MKENTYNAEIAFFGGSFTAIDKEYMTELLDATAPYIDCFKGIRISTRPDCIDDEILSFLKKYKVTSIELGAQSMCDDVLWANNRGHSAQDVINASQLIKKYGFSLGLQMMTGLFKSDVQKDIYTAEKFSELKPDTVRIYPTVVMKNTYLAQLFESKEYIPYSFEVTVNLCSQLLVFFDKLNIKVIRLGLHHSETLESDMIAGCYHPAFREICESRIIYQKATDILEDKKIPQGNISITVNSKAVSKLCGQKRCNIKALENNGYFPKIIQDNSLKENEIIIEPR